MRQKTNLFYLGKNNRRLQLNKQPGQNGFALIATITLMVLLALLSVGLLSIAATQTRLSEKTLHISNARAQARLALHIAIGKLQCELGPDQRISAPSSILDSNPASIGIDGVSSPHLLGAWDSWDTWLNRPHTTKELSISATYDQGRSRLFRSWLISSADHRDNLDLNAPKNSLGTARGTSGKKILLVGNGSLGDDKQDSSRIYAGLVQIDDGHDANAQLVNRKNSRMQKSLAWWIRGENQKLRINLPSYSSSAGNDKMAVLRQTWNTPIPDLGVVNELSALNSKLPDTDTENYNREIRRLISKGTLELVGGQRSYGDLGRLYHDITIISSGLQADVKFGGLKKDINILCSQNELPDEYRRNDSDAGLRPHDRQDGTPSIANRPISSWSQLYYWANMWNSSELKRGQDASATLQWQGMSPFTMVASDAEAVSGMMNNKHTYLRQPIPIKYYTFLGIRLYNTGSNLGGAKNRGPIHFGIGVIPVIVYWNPYNVDMQLTGGQGEPWGTFSSQYRMMPLLVSSNVPRWEPGRSVMTDDNLLDTNTEAGVTGFAYKTTNYYDIAKPKRQLADYGSSLKKTVSLELMGEITKGKQSTLQAGEIVIYAYPESIPDWGLSPFSNLVYTGAVENLKAYQYDYHIDGVPLKESWSQSEHQTGQYATRSDGTMEYLMFAGLTGPEFGDEPKYLINVRFAEKTDDLNLTPDEFILASKFTRDFDTSGNLGTFVYAAGLMNPDKIGQKQDHISKADGGSKDPEIYTKISPYIFAMNWGAWEKPLVEKAYIPQELWDNTPVAGYGEESQKKGAYYPKGASAAAQVTGHPVDGHLTFIAYYGVSAKWNARPLIGVYPDDRDYRAKTWQHSSPLFWGSQMTNASELSRTYSPYQFEIKFANDEFAPITINNVLSNDGTKNSVFGGPNGVQINKICAAELPLHPPYSLAGFAGMRLTPGWYESGQDKIDIAKRFAYQSGVPGVGIGNSFADPMLPAEQIYSHNEISNDPELGDFWDHALIVNDGLWDTWYASSLSSRPNRFGGSAAQNLEQTVTSAFEQHPGEQDKPALSNSRYTINTNGHQASEIISMLTAENGYKKSSQFIRVDGAFNVNSTSLPAWTAILSGLKNRQILYMGDSGPQILRGGNNNTVFSRFAIASSDTSHVDDLGATGVSNGIMDGEKMAWTDLRKIDSSQMQDLAEKIIEQVKKRGPFLNMSEFINRRLQTGELGLKGALQTAIDQSGLNSVFDQMSGDFIDPPATYPHQEAARGSYYTAAPGYLIQSDVLAVLGNILTVRDDTFTIRAYGEIADRKGAQILARAWCEAVVQRQIDYVDPTDSPETPATEIKYADNTIERSNLSSVNRAFGRKMEIISFKWLSQEEI